MTSRRYRTLLSDSALWEGFRFRDGDVVISPPPKCGTTWMQMLCALLIFGTDRLPRPLTEISPWVDAVVDDHRAVVAALEAQRHRRFLKTHTPLDGLVVDERVTYICVGRDPRDVALSYARSMANLDPATFQAARAAAGLAPDDLARPPADPLARFRRWAESEGRDDQRGAGATLARMVHHVQTFWDRRDEPRVVLFHYSDLLADLPGQMRRLADRLGIDVSDEELASLAAAASFDRMRARADELAPGVGVRAGAGAAGAGVADAGAAVATGAGGRRPLWRDNRAFFHSGTDGQWRGLLGPDDLARYHERLAELAAPDLVDWLHGGWLGSRVADEITGGRP
jgi:aryl sulfotransferase